MNYALFFKNHSFYNELYTVRLGAILRPFWRREGSMAELSRAEPARDEPSRVEPGRAEPSRAEPARDEPSRAEPGQAGPSRAEPRRAELSRARAEPSRAGAGRAEPEPSGLFGPAPSNFPSSVGPFKSYAWPTEVNDPEPHVSCSEGHLFNLELSNAMR